LKDSTFASSNNKLICNFIAVAASHVFY